MTNTTAKTRAQIKALRAIAESMTAGELRERLLRVDPEADTDAAIEALETAVAAGADRAATIALILWDAMSPENR